jgi:hypothetical protein
MTEVFEHNLGDHEDPLPGPTWIIAFLGIVLLSVIMLGLTALYYNAQHQEQTRKVVVRDPMELQHLRETQQAQLTRGPAWVEEKVKVEGQNQEQVVPALVIPIDQAMDAVVKEYARK